jgi:SpoVK/Ycf46/Vps4 family AAA+-type ATPase
VLPPHLATALHVLDFPLPDRAVFEELITGSLTRAHAQSKKIAPDMPDELRETIARSLSGLTHDEAESILALSLVTRRQLDPALISAQKTQIIRKSDVLEMVSTTDRLEDVGGHDHLKAWLREAQLSFSDKARTYGIEPVRATLFAGIPGTAKSLIATAIGTSWNLPVVRLDMGRLMGGLVGESEHRAREMTRIVKAIAPCVLHADEVEKGIGGVESSAHTDSGTTARVFGHLLTWLQEARAPFFLVGTANRPELIPPEFLRRLDAVWWFDVPAPEERRQIWEIHLRKRGRDPRQFDLAHLIAESEGYTGAEIEKAVKQALRRAFLDSEREPGADDLVDALREAEPIRRSHAERLDQARRSLRGLEKPTIRHDHGSSSTTATPELGVRLFDLN